MKERNLTASEIKARMNAPLTKEQAAAHKKTQGAIAKFLNPCLDKILKIIKKEGYSNG